MTEQFRKVEPLLNYRLWTEDPFAETDANDVHTIWIGVDGLTVPEARALRDWLNKALPEDAT